MNVEMNVAGTPATAPATATETAARKVMVLAIHRDKAGGIVITPIDIEHEDHDPSRRNRGGEAMRAAVRSLFKVNHAAMKTALDFMFGVYEQRLYSEKFRTFADYWAEIFGTNPIDDVVAEKVKSEAAKFKMKLEEEQP